jgi:hypothetical protein
MGHMPPTRPIRYRRAPICPIRPVFGLTGGPINSGIVTFTPEQFSDLFSGL